MEKGSEALGTVGGLTDSTIFLLRAILDAAGGSVTEAEVMYFKNFRTIARTSVQMWLEEFHGRLLLLAQAQAKKSGKKPNDFR